MASQYIGTLVFDAGAEEKTEAKANRHLGHRIYIDSSKTDRYLALAGPLDLVIPSKLTLLTKPTT